MCSRRQRRPPPAKPTRSTRKADGIRASMPEGRRGLLRKTLAGAVLLVAAGAVPVALRRTRLRTPRKPLSFFSEAEYSIWAAVADRVLARDASPATEEGDGALQAALRGERRPAAPSPSEIDVAGKADAFLALLSEADARDLKRLLALFDNALFNFSTRPFTQLDAAGQ